MKGEIYIPTISYTNNFEYNGKIDSDTYVNMLNNSFSENYYEIDNFMKNGRRINYKNPFVSEINNNIQPNNDVSYTYKKTIATINNINNNDLSFDELNDIVLSNDMSVLILDIDYNCIDEDTEEELLLWIKDSMNINNSNNIDQNKKLLYLPNKTLKLKYNNLIFDLKKCRILDNYKSINKGEFNFAILVEKIINTK